MDIYERLQMKRIINGMGTCTILGGTLMDARVLEAMAEASRSYVDLVAFHHKAGEHIAKLAGAEACCITNGAAGGLAVAAAACMAGTDVAKIRQLPITTGMKGEALVLKAHRTLYDQALLLSGIRPREIGKTSCALIEEVEYAISEQTACFVYTAECETMRGSLPFPAIVNVMRRHGIPTIVDAASEIPPASVLTKYLDMGADLVLFSGGKEIRGPQSSGLILGKKELVEACEANCCPQYSVGRALKLDKETIAGITRAVELFVEKDYGEILAQWDHMAQTLVDRLQGREDVAAYKGHTAEPGIQPLCVPKAFIRPLRKSAEQLHGELIASSPGIYTCLLHDTIIVNAQCMQPEELDTVYERIAALL